MFSGLAIAFATLSLLPPFLPQHKHVAHLQPNKKKSVGHAKEGRRLLPGVGRPNAPPPLATPLVNAYYLDPRWCMG